MTVVIRHIAARTRPHEVYESSQPREQRRYMKRPTTAADAAAAAAAVDRRVFGSVR